MSDLSLETGEGIVRVKCECEEASISPVADETGRTVSYVAVKRDITRESDLEKQFHEARRMEMEEVGQLGG